MYWYRLEIKCDYTENFSLVPAYLIFLDIFIRIFGNEQKLQILYMHTHVSVCAFTALIR
jgi:hypothetical protein